MRHHSLAVRASLVVLIQVPESVERCCFEKKIKLEVSEADAAALEVMQGKCRGLYNWWVMRLRDGEHWPGVYEAKKSLQASKAHDPELEFVYGKLLHEVYYRMDRDENSAHNILMRSLARLGPHTGDPVRCADVFTAIEHVLKGR